MEDVKPGGVLAVRVQAPGRNKTAFALLGIMRYVGDCRLLLL